MLQLLKFLIITLLFVLLSNCGGKKSETSDGKVYVVTTTTMITDMVKQVAGDKVRLKSLMGPGVDPHLYEPIPTDAIALSEADVIFYNGLKLEGQMSADLIKMNGVALSSVIDKNSVTKIYQILGLDWVGLNKYLVAQKHPSLGKCH